MNEFGKIIRQLREKRSEPLRITAFHLNVDQAILSKIENGKRVASVKQVELIANYFGISKDDLLTDWFCDKIYHEAIESKLNGDVIKKVGKRILDYDKVFKG